jgi:hypothetical protein
MYPLTLTLSPGGEREIIKKEEIVLSVMGL